MKNLLGTIRRPNYLFRNLRMKLSLLFLMTALIPIQAHTSYPQENLTLDVDGISLEWLLDEIENLTEYRFVYKTSDVDLERQVTLKVEKMPVIGILDRIFSNTTTAYTIREEQVILSRKTMTTVQSIVRGRVTDSHGVPLAGVNIQIQGQGGIGAVTDFDGNYQIAADQGDVLVFTFVGMQEQAVGVQESTLNIIMEDSVESLQDVVITGYQSIDQKVFTGAASTITPEEIQQVGVPEVSRMLEGKVAGVSIQNVSGTFGTGPKITIRGASSIYGETRPLWVVDGVVLEDVVNVTADQLSSGNAETVIASSIAGLNAEDIQSIEVLKDVSATSLYGARAMNGVVVVTTKSGRAGSLQVNYSGQFAVNMKPNYDEYNVMNSQEQIGVMRELYDKGNLGMARVANARNGGIFNRYYLRLSELNDGGGFQETNTPEALNAFLQRYELMNTDWFDELFNNSLTQTHSVSMSGGSEKIQVYASTSLYTDPGWSESTETDRMTANINSTFHIRDNIQLGALANMSLRKQMLPGTFSRTTDVVNGQFERDFDINPFSYALNTSRASSPYDENGDLEYYRMNYTDFNILHELQNNQIFIDVLDTKFQLDFKWDITDDITFQSVGNMRYVKSTQEHKVNEESNAANAYRAMGTTSIIESNRFLFSDPDYPNRLPKTVLPYGGFYNRTDNNLESYYLRNTLDYHTQLNNIHDIAIFAGQEIRFVDRDNSFHEGVGIQYNKGNSVYVDPDWYKFRAMTSSKPFSLGYQKDRFLAYFARGSYAYDDRYVINATVRYDGSNRLGKSNTARWLPTWNVGGAWNLSNEPFLRNSGVVSNLKLRLTHGLSANLGVAENALAIFRSNTTVRRDASNVENAIYISALENSELTWEKQHETNLGLDLGLWNNRITLNTDLYLRKGFDLIDYVETSGIGGQKTKPANFADMTTRGIDFSLNTRNFVGQDFQWTTNFILGFNDQEITRLENSPRVIDLIMSNGGALLGGSQRGLYSIPFEGLDEEGIPTFINESGEKSRSVYFQSRDVEFLKYEGRVAPSLTMGLTNRFRYKNWEFDFFFSYQGGNKIRLDPAFSSTYNDLSVFTNEFKNRWIIPGDENHTSIPTILSGRQLDEDNTLSRTYNAYNYSTERVADGDFLRLKTVGLTYNFNADAISSLGLTRLSMQVQTVNPWLVFSDKKLRGQDPEFFRSGGVAFPITKMITYSLRIGF